MTLQEKLDLFYKAAMEDATSQRDALLSEYEKSLDNTFEKFKKDVLLKAEAMVQSEEEHLIREKNKVLSLAAKEIKKNIAEETAKYKEETFVEVNKRLLKFMESEAYVQFLIKRIKNALRFARKEEITIYINPSDEDKKERLEEETKAALTVSKIDFMGGIRAVVHAKNVLIDDSFVTRIEEEKEKFSI